MKTVTVSEAEVRRVDDLCLAIRALAVGYDQALVATALAFELASVLALRARDEAEAIEGLNRMAAIAAHKIAAHPVGAMHPIAGSGQ